MDPSAAREGVAASPGTELGLLRSMAVLMSGTALAQVLTVGSTPLLSRLYDPSEFGALGLVNAVAGALVGVSALRYDVAVVLPERDEDAANLLWLSIGTIVATGMGTALLLAILGPSVARAFGSAPLAGWLWLVPPILVATALYNALTYWCTRRAMYRRMSRAAVIAAGASASGKAALGLAGWGSGGLVYGQLLGQVTATVSLTVQVARDDWRALVAAFSRERIRGVARRYSEFPRFQAPLTLINAGSRHLPVYLLAAFFGAHEVGLWTLMLLVVGMPVTLVSNAVRQVLLRQASRAINERQAVLRLLVRSTLAITGVVAPLALLGAVIAPWTFSTLLGAEWYDAGVFAQWGILWQATVLVSTPATAIYPVLRNQRKVLIWQLLTTSLSAFALYVGQAMGTALYAIATFSAVLAAMNVVLIGLVMWDARDRRVFLSDHDDAGA